MINVFVRIFTLLMPLRRWRHGIRSYFSNLDSSKFKDEILAIKKSKRKLAKLQLTSKKVLIVVHDLTITGAPIVALLEIKALINKGFSVMVAAAAGGDLAQELDKIGVEVIVSPLFFKSKFLVKYITHKFDLVIVNSIAAGNWVLNAPPNVPLIWLIHESKNITSYIEKYPELENALRLSENLYTVSEHAAAFLPMGIKYKLLHLGIPDVTDSLAPYSMTNTSRLKIAVIGTYVWNKGQHLLLEALEQLTDRLDEFQIFFIGKDHNKHLNYLKKQCNPIWPVVFMDHIALQDKYKWDIYNEFDIFCIPSFDESCSLVVLEACMLSKPLIISDQVGARYMLEEGENGVSFIAGDVKGLAQCIIWCLDNRDNLEKMGQISRKHYEMKSSWEVFKKALTEASEEAINNFRMG